MSEFRAIIDVIGTVVNFVFEATLDVICGVLMFAACLAFWNITRILDECTKNQSRNDWRSECIGLFLTALLDFILLPFCVLIVLSPMRWSQFLLHWSQNKNDMDFRGNVAAMAMGGLLDLWAYIGGLVLLTSPFGRISTICKGAGYYFRADIERDFEAQCNAVNKLSSKVIVYAAGTFVDWALVIILLPFLVVTPTVWGRTYRGITLWLTPANQPSLPASTNARYLSVWKDWYETLWTFLYHQILHCWLDILHAPCLLLVLLSPLRLPAFWRKVRSESARVEQIEQSTVAPAADRLEDYDFYYSQVLREDCRRLAALAIADLLLLPMLLPLWLTQYRYRGVQSKLWPTSRSSTHEVIKIVELEMPPRVAHVVEAVLTSGDTQESGAPTPTVGPATPLPKSDATTEESSLWGLDEFFLIATQAALLFTDLFILLVPVPLLYVTQYRWAPVHKVLTQSDVFVYGTSTLYATVLGQVSMMLWDVVLAPFAVVVLLTSYRAEPIRRILANTSVLNREGCRLHAAVMLNFLCIAHDVCLLLPVVLLLPFCLVAYRAPFVARLISKHIDNQRAVRERQRTERELLHDDADISKLLQLLIFRGIVVVVTYSSCPLFHCRADIYPPTGIRVRLWLQCVSCLLDLPFVALFLVVLVTGWRAAELIASIRYAIKSERISYDRVGSFWSMIEQDNKLRKCVVKQFGYLCRDVLLVVPMTVILATLYRAPQLLGLLLAALWQGGAALASAPVFQVESCHVEFPLRGGPRINFAVSKRRSTAQAEATEAAGAVGPVSSVPVADAAPTVVRWDATSRVELHVVSDTLWESAERILGKFLVSLVRSYLPLQLVDTQTIGWSDFLNDESLTTLTASTTVVPTGNALSSPQLSLWMRLNLGTTKRTTILKKLRLLSPSAVIKLQLEAFAHCAVGQPGTPAGAEGPTVRQKMVLLCVKPTVDDLVTVLTNLGNETADLVSGALPVSALVNDTTATTAVPVDPLSPQARRSNFVNSFHSTVQQVWLEVLIDVAALGMFLLTILSPMRFVRLLVALLERPDALPGRICTNMLRSVRHLDNHLLEYRKQVAGPLNLFFKDKFAKVLAKLGPRYESSTAQDNARHRYERVLSSLTQYLDNDMNAQIKAIEKYHLSSYQTLCRSTLKSLSYFPGCEAAERLLKERLALHEEMVLLWNLRAAAGVQYRDIPFSTVASPELSDSAPVSPVSALHTQQPKKPFPHVDRARFELVQLVLIEESDRVAQRLAANDANMHALENELNASPTANSSTSKGCSSWKDQCGVFVRPIDETRKLILLMFLQAMSDVGFMLLLAFLVVTLVRALPVVQELHSNRTWSPLRYTTRWILIKHVKQLVQDIKHICLFLLYTLIIVVTVGGLPRFFADLPAHMGSYYAATECAKEHAGNVLENIWDLLTLLTAFRTYRIAVKSALYCVIIPGACLAEAFPLPDWSAAVRFTIGMGVWVALLIGGIVVNVRAVVQGDGQASEQSTSDTRAALLAWCGAVFGVLFISALSVAHRPAYNRPDCHAVRSPQITWDHLLAVLTGPVESIQLSAVVLYFFWNFARGNNASQVDGGDGHTVLTTLGPDAYAAVLMIWAPSPTSDGQYNNGVSSSSDGSSTTGVRSSLMVAALLVMCYSILIAAPIATSSSDTSHRREKVLAIKSSAIYEFLMIALSRLLTVWIIATLMRSASCVHVQDAADASADGFAVVSTAQHLQCGDGDWWAAVASLALLAYYMLTSSILHADDADLLRSASATKQAGVKFAPLYALSVRAVQFFVCAACFAGFYANSSLVTLVPVLIMAILVTLLPTMMYLTMPAGGVSGQVCSVATIAVLRSAGFLCVAWTAIVCIVRNEGGRTGIFTSETTVYVGWGVIYAVALALAVWEDWQVRTAWRRRTEESGLVEATSKLLEIVHGASVSESVNQESICCRPSPRCESSFALIPFVSRHKSSARSSIEPYAAKVADIRSYRDLAVLLLQLEQVRAVANVYWPILVSH
jgi:hypothetical protein